ncbi:hypothetical protein UK23_07055 [Lentzea aerocolonigenes]|uniref:Uncharacterized protein n=1 Tax=Lentzea aerocolonigenes TaxID=68170 RepID=A0A0F0H6W1_LENAE|nr:hypothetical protein [Lentzea aerocolonigenes]KJK51260.1 hypothetical protein UK23_07055 [Lentzea aerocolonigenes]
MKNTLSLACVVAAVVTFSVPVAHAAVGVEDLGTLPGDVRSTPQDINEGGAVAGVSTSAANAQHAVRWDPGAAIKKLDDLGSDSWAAAINSQRVVVGYAVDSANHTQPARWDFSGSLTVLTTPGAVSGVAYDVNDSGSVTGSAVINGVSHAVVWDSAGVATDLGEGSGRYLTSSGTVIGYSGDQPARWSSGLYVYDNHGAMLSGHNEAADAVGTTGGEGVLWLGRRRSLLGAGTSPRDISDNGWAVGVSGSQAVRWAASEFTTAQPLAPAPSAATKINNAGVVAGTAGSWAVTWNAAGVQTALPVLAGSNRSSVSGLTENGQVIGIAGFADGTWRAVVWR